MPRYTLRGLLVVVTAIGCCSGILRGCYIALTQFEAAENVARVAWLPESASNISYYRSYNYTAYEFDMSEDEFKKWIWLSVEPITKPVEVRRHSFITASRPDLGPNPTLEELEAWEAIGTATIVNGLYHLHRRGNGGGVDVAFDRNKSRVYFQSNPR
jgi:hypothetical protein